MPPQDPRTPGLVGSNIQIGSAQVDNETLRQLNESDIDRSNRLREEAFGIAATFPTPGQLKEQKRQRSKLCRNTQKIGDTVYRCMMKHEESDTDPVFGPQHEERGRVIKDGVTTKYLIQWWDAETEVIR